MKVLAVAALLLPVLGWVLFMAFAPTDLPEPPPAQLAQWVARRQPPPPPPPAPALPIGRSWANATDGPHRVQARDGAFLFVLSAPEWMKSKETWDNRKSIQVTVPVQRSNPWESGWQTQQIPSPNPPTEGGTRWLTGVPMRVLVFHDSYLPNAEGPSGRFTLELVQGSANGPVVFSQAFDLDGPGWGPAERRERVLWFRKQEGIPAGGYWMRLLKEGRAEPLAVQSFGVY